MIQLLAVSKQDGWGVIRTEEGTLRLLRPPYTTERCPLIQDADVARLLSDPGFDRVTQDSNWPDTGSVIAYLKQATVNAAGPDLSNQAYDAAQKRLAAAPPDRVRHFLDRIREALILQYRYNEAQNVLITLLGSRAANEDPALREEMLELMRQCTPDGRQQTQHTKGRSIENLLEGKLENQAKYWTNLFAARHQVLQPGG